MVCIVIPTVVNLQSSSLRSSIPSNSTFTGRALLNRSGNGRRNQKRSSRGFHKLVVRLHHGRSFTLMEPGPLDAHGSRLSVDARIDAPIGAVRRFNVDPRMQAPS